MLWLRSIDDARNGSVSWVTLKHACQKILTPCAIPGKRMIIGLFDLHCTDPVQKKAKPLIDVVIPSHLFYGPARPPRKDAAAVTSPVPADPPKRPPVSRRPTTTALEKIEMERQRVALSRAVSRKMRVPTGRMSSGDFFATVNVDNITELSARCAIRSWPAVTGVSSPKWHMSVAGTSSAIGPPWSSGSRRALSRGVQRAT